MPHELTLWQELGNAAAADLFLVVASVIFALAVLHAFLTSYFAKLAHQRKVEHDAQVRLGLVPVNERGESADFRASLLHLLGEVEAVFGLWALALFVLMVFWPGKGWDFACRCVESGNYDLAGTKLAAIGPSKFLEPLFVFIIMVLASARPVMRLAERLLGGVARGMGDSVAARWFVILTLAPLLGSLITEPAAMTIAALLLSAQFYALRPTERLKYATLALLFVNISVGGALTHFAAPPVVMVAAKWGWGLSDVFCQFGWAAMATIFLSTTATFIFFRSEFAELALRAKDTTADNPRSEIPFWVILGHLALMVWTVLMLIGHHPVLMVGGLLVFLAFTEATSQWQTPVRWRGPLLVGLFLAGLVVLGGTQSWWISPLIARLDANTLMFSATVLTAFNDNAAITFLAAQVPALSLTGAAAQELRHAVMAGALAGGGLTVIANAPNPAGQSILAKHFAQGVSPLKLALWAALPTGVAVLCFIFIR